MKAVRLAFALVMMAPVLVSADDRPAAEKPAETPATKPAEPGKVVEVTDLETIKANVGNELNVRGKVSGTYKSRTGSVILINFEGVNRDFVAAIEKDSIDAVNAGFSGDITAAVEGKTLLITGPIKLYKDKPQVVITKPEQVKIEEEKKE